MENNNRQSEYSQSGLSSPYPSFPGPSSEGSSADQESAAQYPQGQDPRASSYTASATPPTIGYSSNRPSAVSGAFPDYIRNYSQPATQGAATANMAQPQNPNISTTSPTYPQHGSYSPAPYQPTHGELQQHYQPHPTTPMYPRPDWSAPQQHAHMHYGYSGAAHAPAQQAMASPVQRPPTGGHPLSTVYSFVPIPGAQQHKRPRRRYEEIERMYKCGWQGCEKAYGTLNHLNAHVTMQGHGIKRTPEEFKEIRKEWKAKKKEEENQRKAEEEARQRAAAGEARAAHEGAADAHSYGRQSATMPGQANSHAQLPPIGYQPAASGNASATQYTSQGPAMNDGMTQYGTAPSNVYNSPNSNGSSYPASPYSTQNPNMYPPPSH